MLEATKCVTPVCKSLVQIHKIPARKLHEFTSGKTLDAPPHHRLHKLFLKFVHNSGAVGLND